jgi:Zn-dependent M28 family amino/carboxypeptidase
MRALAFAVAITILLPACTTGPDGGQKLTDPVIDVAALKQMTETLASDAFEGRAPMTPGEDRTVAYIAEQFAAAGLSPGHSGGWFQDVPLVEQTVAAATADMTFAVPGGAAFVAKYGADVVTWSKRVEPRITVRDSELVFVGYGINAPEKGWNDYAGVDVAGKTVLILVNDPDWQTPTLDGPFRGRAMTYYGRWTYKYEEAARQGAAAAIIIHDTEPAGYGWKTVASSWTGPQIDKDGSNVSVPRVAIEAWLQKPVASRLLAAAGADLASLTLRAKSKNFRAISLGIKMSVQLDNAIRKARSKNVVGILPGQAAVGEHVIYTAHWDHLGRCGADATGDDICNGALDNATGTAGLIALAKAHGAAGPARRSLLFVAVTGEESGLLGSAWYADNPSVPLAATVAGINMDGLNIVGPTHDVVVIGGGKSELEALLAEELARQGRRIEPEPKPENGSYYRSDHFSLAKKGVPMLYADSGIDIVGKGRAFGQARADDYTANRYHQPGDEYDPAWNWEGALQDLTLNYRIGRRIADGDAWPNWLPGDEFRAVRDASLAAGR